jgi:hypothetical protein
LIEYNVWTDLYSKENAKCTKHFYFIASNKNNYLYVQTNFAWSNTMDGSN